MPRIPKYRRQKLPPTNVGAAPISTRTADVAGGAVGRGLAAIGRGVGGIGEQLFRIEQEKQANRDKIATSQANRDLDNWIVSDISRIENQRYDSINDMIADRDGFGKRYTDKINELKAVQNENVSALFEAGANNSFVAAQYRLNRRTIQKEENMAASGWSNDVASLYRNRPPIDSPVYKDWKKRYDDSRDSYSFYLNEHDLESQEIQSLINEGLLALAAQKLDESKRLDANDKAILKSRIDSGVGQANAVIEAKINEANKEIVDTLVDDPLNLNVINGLPIELKQIWETKLAEREAFMKANPDNDLWINTYDATTFNALDTLLNSAPKKLLETEIVNDIGRGLTLSDAQTLINKKRNLEKTSKLRTSNPGFSRAYQRIRDAYEDDTIKHPGFVRGAKIDSEDDKQNRIYTGGLLDQLTEWTEAEDRSHVELNKYIDDLLRPHQEMEARGIIDQLFHNVFSRESWVFSAGDYRSAIESLNADAQKDWEFSGMGEKGHRFWGGISPEDFLHRWRNPHKKITPEVKAIYIKWAHGDEDRAYEMMVKDEWNK